jgi:F-type H+-transporting ATPase subunit gamma
MHNATESARDLVEDMTVELNRSRQADITEELSDVIAATELLAHGGTGE